MAEREFSGTVYTTEEGGIVVIKLGGRLFVAAGGVNLVGIGVMNSKGGVHIRGEINDVAQRSVVSMVAGGNISWERMSGSEMMATIKASFCCWRRYSTISILKILTLRRYSCRFSASLRLMKDPATRTKLSVYWKAACCHRSRRVFVLSQDESTQPRASSELCSAPASNWRGVLSNSVKVW